MNNGTWGQTPSTQTESFWSRGSKALRFGGKSGTSTEITAATSSAQTMYNSDQDPATISPASSSEASPIPIARIYSHLSSASSQRTNRSHRNSGQRPRHQPHDIHYNEHVHSFDDEMNIHKQTNKHYASDKGNDMSNRPISTIAKLNRAFAESTSRNFAIKRNFSRDDTMVSNLKNELAQCKQSLEEANKKLNRNQSTIEACGDMQTELDKTHASLITANMRCQQLELEYEQNIEGLKMALMEKQKRIDEVLEQNNGNQNSPWKSDIALASLQKRLKAAEALAHERNTSNLSQTQISNRNMEVMTRKIEQLNNEIRENKQSSKITITALEEELTTLKDSLNEAGRQNEVLKNQISKKNEEISSTRSQLSKTKDMQRRTLSIDNELMDKENLIKKLQSSIEDYKCTIHELQSREKVLESNYSNSMDDSREEEVMSLQRSLNIMSEQLSSSKARSQSTIQHLKETINNIEEKNIALEIELKELKTKQKNNGPSRLEFQEQKKIHDLEEENTSLQFNLNSTREKLAQTETELNDLRKDFESLDTEDINASISVSATQLSNLQKSIDDKNMKLIDMKAESQKAKSTIKAKDTLITELKNEISSLSSQIVQLQDLGKAEKSAKKDELENAPFNAPSAQLVFLADSNEKICSLEAQISEAKGDCKAKDEAMSVMKQSLNEALGMLRPLQKLVSNAEIEKSKHIRMHKEAQEKIASLEKVLLEANEKRNQKDSALLKQKHSQEINSYINQIKELELELRTADECRKRVEDEEKKLRSEIENTRKVMVDMEKSLGEVRKSESSLRISLNVTHRLFSILDEILLANDKDLNRKSLSRKNGQSISITSKKIDIYIDLIETLMSNREELKEQQAMREKQLSESSDKKIKIDHAKKELQGKTNKLKITEREIKNRSDKISDYNYMESELQSMKENKSRVKLIERDLINLKTLAEQKDINIATLREKLADATEELKAEKIKLEQLKNDTKIKSNRDSTIRIASYQKKLIDLRKKLQQTKESESALEEKLNDAKNQIQRLEREVSLQSNTQLRLENELQYASKTIHQMRAKVEYTEKKDLGANYERIKAERNALDNRMALHNTMLSDIPNISSDTSFGMSRSFQKEGIQDTIADLESKLAQTERLYNTTKKKLDVTLADNVELKEELKILEGEVIETVEEIEQLRETLEKREKELENAKYIATCTLMKIDELSSAAGAEGGLDDSSFTESDE